MADWSTPSITALKVDVLNLLKARDVDAISLSESITNPPTGAIRWVTSSNKLQRWNGSTWVDLVLAVESGGTGGSNPSTARTALGLGTMATQNSNAVSISGGTISGLSALSSSGNITAAGVLILGSAPTVVSNSAGQVIEAAIEDGPYLARNAGNETITGVWTFSNTINANVTSVNDGMYLSVANQFVTGRKIFSGSQSSGIANPAANLGGIELYGAGGTAAAYMSFHRPGQFAVYFGLDTDNSLKVGGYSLGATAYTILHSNNFNTYAPSLGGTGAVGTWSINISGNSASTSALTTAITINGTPVNVGSNVTITCAAGTLTGATLNSSVVNSSLTSVGTLTNLTVGGTIAVGNGTASTPSVRFAGSSNSGMYLSGSAAEFGARFDNANRAVMRAYTSGTKLDFLLGVTVPLELGDSIVYVGPTDPANLQVRGDITPAADNTYQIGYGPGGRFQEVWATNGTIQTSDIRMKKVHEWLTGREALESVLKFETFIGSWTEDRDEKRFLSLSAQNIQHVVDEKYHTKTVRDDNPDCLGMNPDNLIPLLAAAIRGLDDKIQHVLDSRTT